MNLEPLGPLDPDELKPVTLPFARQLAGATIVTVDYFRITVKKGTDADPQGMAFGLPVPVGTDVAQRIDPTGHPPGTVYKLKARVIDSNGNKHVSTDDLLVDEL